MTEFINSAIVVVKSLECNWDLSSDFSLSFIWGGNSSIVKLSNSQKINTSSEPWFSDNSDIFGFDINHYLCNLELSIPLCNKVISLNKRKKYFGTLFFIKDNLNSGVIVPPTKFRYFDSASRLLICTKRFLSQDMAMDLVEIKSDFFLLFFESSYFGFVLKNPLSYLTSNAIEKPDYKSEPNSDEYELINRFFEIMSENNLEKLNDDMGMLVHNLDKTITPRLSCIKSNFRKKIITDSIHELLDFYL